MRISGFPDYRQPDKRGLTVLYLTYNSGLKFLPKQRGRLALPITKGLILIVPVALAHKATVIRSLERLTSLYIALQKVKFANQFME